MEQISLGNRGVEPKDGRLGSQSKRHAVAERQFPSPIRRLGLSRTKPIFPFGDGNRCRFRSEREFRVGEPPGAPLPGNGIRRSTSRGHVRLFRLHTELSRALSPERFGGLSFLEKAGCWLNGFADFASLLSSQMPE